MPLFLLMRFLLLVILVDDLKCLLFQLLEGAFYRRNNRRFSLFCLAWRGCIHTFFRRWFGCLFSFLWERFILLLFCGCLLFYLYFFLFYLNFFLFSLLRLCLFGFTYIFLFQFELCKSHFFLDWKSICFGFNSFFDLLWILD